MTKSLISLRDIDKSWFSGGINTRVLKQLSLSIDYGELVAIVGASGSGKSTLMNLIGLLDRPDSGRYILDQQNVASLDEDERAALRNHYIGFVFQQFHLLPRFSAFYNVALPLVYRNIKASEQEARVMDALKRVGMQDYAARRPNQLSGGQQQRVAIARALVGEPQMILADEPTGALDSRTGAEVLDLFLSLHHEGRTIIMVTHDEHIAAQCARRITMADGEIASEARQ